MSSCTTSGVCLCLRLAPAPKRLLPPGWGHFWKVVAFPHPALATAMFSSLCCPGRSSGQPLQFPSTSGLFPTYNTYTSEYTTNIQHVGDSPAWRAFASKLLPLHHALGAGNCLLLKTVCSLQKHLSSTVFFQPLQKSGVTQTWQNVRPCSMLRF